MSYFSYAILGIIQGLTEFLPVSSSGHLVLMQEFFPSFSQPGILLEVFLHAGTLTAILYYFRADLKKLGLNYYFNILVGTIPAVFVGLFFKDQVEVLFESVRVVGFALLITSFFNFATDKKKVLDKKTNYKNSFIIGVFQAFAIIPGISRSGSTIFASRSLGVSKHESARFSFLLSVPAILGANFLELTMLSDYSSFSFGPMALGFLAAFISGNIAIRFTIKSLEEKNFKYFAIYTVVLGLLVLFI